MLPPNDPLPSWHEGKVKSRIFEFIEQITDPNSSSFVPEEDRIATFDNDGTLWVEKPLMAQLAFYKRELFDADVLENGGLIKRALNWFYNAVLDIFDLLKMLVAYLYSGFTTDEYRDLVAKWISEAKHPRYKRLYTDLTYKPMLELMTLLSHHGFTNYIVTGGTSNFVRPWSEEVYKVPTEHIIGSSVRTRLGKRNGDLAVKLEPIPLFIENRKAKVLAIERILAKRPIAAFGNSRGDVEMLRWARTQDNSLCMLVHHTDDEREYKYSPDTIFTWGKSTLKYAEELNWQVIDMKQDWKYIFAHEINEEA